MNPEEVENLMLNQAISTKERIKNHIIYHQLQIDYNINLQRQKDLKINKLRLDIKAIEHDIEFRNRVIIELEKSLRDLENKDKLENMKTGEHIV